MIVWKLLSFLQVIALLIGFNDAGNEKSADRRFIWYCVNGLLYRENNCRWCLCVMGLLSTCVGLFCYTDEYYSLKQCRIGSRWRQGCNDCICVRQFGTVCTTRTCDSTGQVYDGYQDARREWTNGHNAI